MNVYFENLGERITIQQAELLGEYYKIFTKLDGLTKKIEKYLDSRIASINYYLDDNETEDQIKGILSITSDSFGIIARESYGNYNIEKTQHYLNLQLTAKTRFLSSNNKEIRCYQELDLNTNQPILDETKKYLGFYNDETSTHYAHSHYDSNGNLSFCEYNYFHDYDSEQFDQQTIIEIKDRFNLSEAVYNYYLTAEFFPPLA